jgi:uncharacterized protein YuzE
MKPDSPLYYDQLTDTMYVTLREGRVIHTVAHGDRDYAIDIGEDGQHMGYEIQFASKHPDVIAEALEILQRTTPSKAAEWRGRFSAPLHRAFCDRNFKP